MVVYAINKIRNISTNIYKINSIGFLNLISIRKIRKMILYQKCSPISIVGVKIALVCQISIVIILLN